MINSNYIDDLISEKLIKANEIERAVHVPSGKLSASMLGWPLREQVLKLLGVQGKQIDPYVLRKFKRGHDVEEWVLSMLDSVLNVQVEVEYLDCVGFIDAMIQHSDEIPELAGKVIPHEIKSITNAKFRRIIASREADPQHRLQATLYALAKKSPYYAIDYVASDDLRVETFVYPTTNTKFEVDSIIKEVADALKKTQETKKLPPFIARYKWQENPMYTQYPEFREDSKEVEKILSKLII